MIATLLTPPASEPVTLDEANAWLRLSTNDEDALVTSLIVAARCAVEATARRVLLLQTWRLAFDAWPIPRGCEASTIGGLVGPSILSVSFPQVAGVTDVRVIDAVGAAQVIPPASYTLLGAPNAARLLFASAPPAPGRAIGGIEVDVVVGYGASAADVPQPLRQAILMLTATWFENRGDDDGDRTHLPASVAALVAPFRRLRLA